MSSGKRGLERSSVPCILRTRSAGPSELGWRAPCLTRPAATPPPSWPPRSRRSWPWVRCGWHNPLACWNSAPNRSPRPTRRSAAQRGQKRLRVPPQHLVEHVLGVALALPVGEQTLVAQQRIVGAEHDATLKSPADLQLEIRREIAGRPAVQLVPHAGLVQQDRDHLGLPRPRRPRGDDDQVRVAGGDLVEVAWVAGVQAHAAAAGLAGAETGGA